MPPSEDGKEGAQEGPRLILGTSNAFDFWPNQPWARVTQKSMRRPDILNECLSLKLRWDYCHLSCHTWDR